MGLWANRNLRLPWRREEEGRPMSAPGLDEMHAIFYATKRQELDQRRTSLMLTDEEDDGAPHRSKVDLDKGTAVLRVRNPESSPGGYGRGTPRSGPRRGRRAWGCGRASRRSCG